MGTGMGKGGLGVRRMKGANVLQSSALLLGAVGCCWVLLGELVASFFYDLPAGLWMGIVPSHGGGWGDGWGRQAREAREARQSLLSNSLYLASQQIKPPAA